MNKFKEIGNNDCKNFRKEMGAHLRSTWCNSAAKEVKREANASTRPPITAVSLVLPRRHAPTTKGADPRETAALKAPTHAETLILWSV